MLEIIHYLKEFIKCLVKNGIQIEVKSKNELSTLKEEKEREKVERQTQFEMAKEHHQKGLHKKSMQELQIQQKILTDRKKVLGKQNIETFSDCHKLKVELTKEKLKDILIQKGISFPGELNTLEFKEYLKKVRSLGITEGELKNILLYIWDDDIFTVISNDKINCSKEGRPTLVKDVKDALILSSEKATKALAHKFTDTMASHLKQDKSIVSSTARSIGPALSQFGQTFKQNIDAEQGAIQEASLQEKYTEDPNVLLRQLKEAGEEYEKMQKLRRKAAVGIEHVKAAKKATERNSS